MPEKDWAQLRKDAQITQFARCETQEWWDGTCLDVKPDPQVPLTKCRRPAVTRWEAPNGKWYWLCAEHLEYWRAVTADARRG